MLSIDKYVFKNHYCYLGLLFFKPWTGMNERASIHSFLFAKNSLVLNINAIIESMNYLIIKNEYANQNCLIFLIYRKLEAKVTSKILPKT